MIKNNESTATADSKIDKNGEKLSRCVALAYCLIICMFFTPNFTQESSSIVGIIFYLCCLVGIFLMVPMRMVQQLLTGELSNFPFYAGLLTFCTLFIAHYNAIKSMFSGMIFVTGIFIVGILAAVIADMIIQRHKSE